MPLRLGGEELVVDLPGNIQKTVNRSPNELDFKRAQMPAVADARDIARARECGAGRSEAG